MLNENERVARQRITSSRLQERNKRIFSMSLGSIRRDIAYRPSHQSLNYSKLSQKVESPNSNRYDENHIDNYNDKQMYNGNDDEEEEQQRMSSKK